MHSRLLSVIFSAPINSYFDITPVGRIINRFSKDLDAIDSLLPDFFLQNLQNLFYVLGILVVCVASTPYFIIIMLPLGYNVSKQISRTVIIISFFFLITAFIFIQIQKFYSKSSREVKRLDVTHEYMFCIREIAMNTNIVAVYCNCRV